jgi:S1-C subfamily serine protease
VNRPGKSRSSAAIRANRPRRLRLSPPVRPIIVAAAACCCAMAVFQPSRALGQQLAPAPLPVPAAAEPHGDVSNLQGVDDYLNTHGEPVEISQLGIMARDGQATLDDGEKIAGVTVVDVSAKGAAAQSLGTHKVSHALVGGALLGAGVASAVLFPPALIPVLMLANSHVGMSYDLVVGVDGQRVRNTMELMQSIADVRSGDTLYLSIVRGGHRLQIPVRLP